VSRRRPALAGAGLAVAVAATLAGLTAAPGAPGRAAAPAPATPALAPTTSQLPAAGQAPAVPTSASADGVTVRAALDPAQGPVHLADRLSLVVTVTAPAGSSVFVPSNPDLGSFALVGSKRHDVAGPGSGAQATGTQPTGARLTEVHTFPLVALRLGVEPIPPIEIPYRLPDGTTGTVHTPRLPVRVVGYLDGVSSPALGPAPPPAPVISTNWTLIWVLGVVGGAVVATVITLLVLRLLRRRLLAAVPPPPPLPPNELALSKLAALETADLDPTARYAGAVDVLREYLGGRYGFDGLESTTRELLAALREADLKGVTDTEIRAMLDEADLMKFARLTATDEQARRRIVDVRAVVDKTWEEPEEAPDEGADPEAQSLEPASKAARVRAGLVDVGLFGALSAAALGLLWTLGLSAWGWVAVVLFGALLAARDLAGPGSPGKALWNLQVVRADDGRTPASRGARLKRNALLLLAPLGLPVESLVLIYHPLGQRLGDQWSGTQVVRAEPPAPRAGQARGGRA